MKQINIAIRGLTPLMMHNVRLANPFDVYVRQIKAMTGKVKKTEDDLLEIARLEWLGGLYYDADIGVHIPGYNVFAAIYEGSKLRKKGAAFKRAAIVVEDKIPLLYEGPRDPDAMFADKRFVDIRSVKVSGKAIMRCRPIFCDWSLKFSVLFDENTIQDDDLMLSITDTGRMIGLGDYSPRFGRFEVVQ